MRTSGDLAWPCLTIAGSHVIHGLALDWQQDLDRGRFWSLGEAQLQYEEIHGNGSEKTRNWPDGRV